MTKEDNDRDDDDDDDEDGETGAGSRWPRRPPTVSQVTGGG